ncbi:MAG: hypothetical protein PHD43_06265 [Methylococcales bacterium]|nr:hypothetical protein [Methylococcales bacterium]
MSDLCPVCKTELKKAPFERGDAMAFLCYRCGDFVLSSSLVAALPSILQENKNADVKISHALRTMQRINKNVELSESIIKTILEKPLPRPQEQADLLIRWLAEHSDNPGDKVKFQPIDHHLSIIGAKTVEGVRLVLSHLNEKGLVIGKGLVNGPVTTISEVNNSFGQLALTFDGWNHYETLLKGSATYRKAFMAMQFGEPDLNAVLENVFKPSVKKAGFDLFKLDDEPQPAGLIDDRLRVEIQSSDFLIADLTHANNGAYWEAGYAEGLGKPVIYTCEKEKFNSPQKPHFDTNHHLTVLWDKTAPEQAGDFLKATIRATLPQLAKLED